MLPDVAKSTSNGISVIDVAQGCPRLAGADFSPKSHASTIARTATRHYIDAPREPMQKKPSAKLPSLISALTAVCGVAVGSLESKKDPRIESLRANATKSSALGVVASPSSNALAAVVLRQHPKALAAVVLRSVYSALALSSADLCIIPTSPSGVSGSIMDVGEQSRCLFFTRSRIGGQEMQIKKLRQLERNELLKQAHASRETNKRAQEGLSSRQRESVRKTFEEFWAPQKAADWATRRHFPDWQHSNQEQRWLACKVPALTSAGAGDVAADRAWSLSPGGPPPPPAGRAWHQMHPHTPRKVTYESSWRQPAPAT